MSIGSKIREARKAARLTQVELAKKTRLSRSYIGDIEKDRYNPSLSTLKLIAKATNMSLSSLLHNEGEESLSATPNDGTVLAPKMQRLKELREALSMTQADLGKALDISPSAIGMYEQGRREPDNTTLKKLSVIFNVSVDYLLDNQPPQKDSLSALTPKESSHLQKYRALDDDGRALVDGLLDTLHEQRSSKFNTSSDETTAS